MATVAKDVAATPDQVWAVLADGWSYVGWIVGASRMREVDDDWPAVSSRLHHSVGIWPFLINDETRVLECEPPRRLVLQPKAWPVGEGRVEIVLTVTTLPDGRAGCNIVMSEEPAKGPGLAFLNPVGDFLIVKRNTESLARLSSLAAGKAARR